MITWYIIADKHHHHYSNNNDNNKIIVNYSIDINFNYGN